MERGGATKYTHHSLKPNKHNSWDQIPNTTRIIQGGAELLRGEGRGGGRGDQPLGGRVGTRTEGQRRTIFLEIAV